MFIRKPGIFNLHLEQYLFASNYVYRKKVLDVGCKDGYGVKLFDEYAIDWLGIDKENYGNVVYPYRFCQLDLDTTSLTTLNEKFDVIVALQVIEHLKDPIKFLRECVQILNPDGRLVFAVPFNQPHRDHKTVFKTTHEVVSMLNDGGFLVGEVFTHDKAVISGKPLYKNVSSCIGVAHVR